MENPEPTPPAPKVATLYSGDRDNPALAIQFKGGTYNLKYQVSSDMGAVLAGKDPSTVYYANFHTGKTSGNFKTATTIIVIGNPSIDISPFSGESRAKSNFIIQYGNIREVEFNNSAPPTGPPTDGLAAAATATIYVFGTITNVNFAGTRDGAEHQVDVLELDPSFEQILAYRQAMAEWQRKDTEMREQDQFRAKEHPI